MIICRFLRKIPLASADHFDSYGQFVGLYPLPFVILPNLLTLALSYGIFQMKFIKDVSFTPEIADSIGETQAYLSFNNYANLPYNYDILIRRKDGGNMVDTSVSQFYFQLHRTVQNSILFDFEDDNSREQLSFQQFCIKTSSKCWSNDQLAMLFLQNFFNETAKSSPTVRLTFPIAKIDDRTIPLSLVLSNASVSPISYRIENATILRLLMTVTWTQPNSAVKRSLENFGHSLTTYFTKLTSDVFIFNVYHSEAIGDAYGELTSDAAPKLGVSLTLLALFTVISCAKLPWRKSKMPEALAGVFNTLMGIASALGSLNLFAQKGWTSLLVIMPFLVLSIGVDDMFVLLGSWNQTDPRLSVPDRMGKVVSDAFLSVTVTSVTNIASFAVGLIQSTPAIQLFSLYTSVALLFEWFYQMTFFCGVLAYGGYREANQLSSACCVQYPKVKNNSNKPTSKQTKKQWSCDATQNESKFIQKSLLWVIDNSWGRLITLAIYILFLFVSLWSCCQLQTNFAPARLARDGTQLQSYFELNDKFSQAELMTADILILRPPDFRNATENVRFGQFVELIEHQSNSERRHPSHFWLKNYAEWLKMIGSHPSDFYAPLRFWLRQRDNLHWADQLHLIPNQTGLESFALTANYEGLRDFASRLEWFSQLRLTCKQFEEFHPIVYNDLNIHVDHVDVLPGNIMQDAAITALVITFVATLMVPNGNLIFWLVLMVLSVEIGVMGTIRLCLKADLDPISLLTITMSVGFSVEYLLHVAHFYHRSETNAEEMLKAIAWPIVQSSISTSLGVMGLGLIPAYIPRLFFATTITVVLLGLIHGLLILPIIFTCLSTSTRSHKLSH